MKKFTSNPRWQKFWLEWAKPILVMLLVTCAVRSSLADWNDVPTGSMKPTIIPGDRVFVNKPAYDLKVPFTTWHLAEWGNPRRGEIVVFYSPHDEMRLVKRVIGLPGDLITMQNNRLFVNGDPVDYEPLDERFVKEIAAADRPSHEFAAESLTTKTHPVMLSPSKPAMRSFNPTKVPEGSYFMMGDNRDDSFDSRYYGPVERWRIVGRATSVVLSVDRAHYYAPRWHRFFTSLP